MLADQALERFLEYEFKTVLDIGAGSGKHKDIMRQHGRSVTTIDYTHDADYCIDYTKITPRPFAPVDAIWCCHVLEHQMNVGLFLDHVFKDLREGGVLAITVPPLRNRLVGGHVTNWTEGHLIYNLILSGFDCSKARVGVYGYNISVIARKVSATPTGPLAMDRGDIEKIAHLFPLEITHGDEAIFGSVNW